MLPQSSLLKPILLACLGSILIGTVTAFIRLSDLGPMTTGFYRMLFALPFLALWVRWERKNGILQSIFITKGGTGLILAGLFFALDLALLNWSTDHTTIVNATLFNNTSGFLVPLIMWSFFRKNQPLSFIIAMSVGFFGCALLVGESFSINLKNIWGDIVALGSGLMVALYLISLKHIREGITTGFLMFWTGVFSLLFLAFFSYLFRESFWPLTFKDLISVCGQAILVHSIGQSLLAYSIGKIPVTYAALILFLAPTTGAILGWVIYAEPLTFIKTLGMILIMISIVTMRKKS